MGVKLVAEVLLYAPDTLTHREKLAAVALAEDARDKTRQTWNSVVSPKILKGAEVKTEREMLKIIAKLKAKGVLKQLVSGRKGTVAKFRFLPLAPAGALDDLADSQGGGFEHPMDDLADAQGGQFEHPMEGTPDAQGGQFEHPMEASGWSNRVVRVADLNTPTPHTPHISSSSSDATAAPHGEEEDEEKIGDKGKTDNRVADLGTEAAVRHIVDRGIGIDREQARVIVDSIAASMLKRGETVSFWDRYIRRFSDEQLRQRLIDATRARVRGRIITDLPGCGECNPQRRLEDSEGNDLGPCPTCAPAARPAPSADTPADLNERMVQ